MALQVKKKERHPAETKSASYLPKRTGLRTNSSASHRVLLPASLLIASVSTVERRAKRA